MNQWQWKKYQGMPVSKKRLLVKLKNNGTCLRCLSRSAVPGKKRCGTCIQYKKTRRTKMRHDSA